MKSGEYKLSVAELVPGTMFIRPPNILAVVLYVVQVDIFIDDEISSNTSSFNLSVGYLIHDARNYNMKLSPVRMSNLTYDHRGIKGSWIPVVYHYLPKDNICEF